MKCKLLKKIMASSLALAMMLACSNVNTETVLADDSSKSPSQSYVEAMGKGWNLGNSFDGVNTDFNEEDEGEKAWGNPVVTKELIKEIKNKGYDSIRIPMTAYRRYSEVDGKYIMDQEWVDRYKEVVQWAVDEDLYVMVNLHHDSWIWLSNWDGNTESVEYKIYVDLWTQLADEFKDFDEKVCFETINEPSFNDTEYNKAQDKLDMINLAAYNIIRKSDGNNDTRMIVMPTMHTNHGAENSDPLYELINELDDENVIATVHYYSEWVFSANLGRTGFDEALFEWSDTYTPRVAAEEALNIVYNTFTENGVGVIVGEWGLLGYDAGNECNQPGEELKYYEYMDYLADERGICLMFWDNGSGIDRRDIGTYQWKKPLVGAMLEAGIRGERSSYATNLDTIYLSEITDTDIEIQLTLNGNEFKGIEGLTENIDYVFDSEISTIILKKEFVNDKFNKLGDGNYGEIANLVIKFSSGAKWNQYLVKLTDVEFVASTGTTSEFSIPTKFNGSKLRRLTVYDEDGNRVGPNSSWWLFQQYGSGFEANYDESTIDLYSSLLTDETVKDKKVTLDFEFYDGQKGSYTIEINGESVIGIVKDSTEEGGDTEEPDDNNGNNDGTDDGENDEEVTPDDELEEAKPVKPGTNPEGNNNGTLPQTGQGVNSFIVITMSLVVVGIGIYLLRKKEKSIA